MTTYDEAAYRERVNAFPFVRMMGMTLVSARDGKSVMRCRVRKILRNTAGTLHGGAMGALVDMSVATALRSVMPQAMRMTTVEYKVNFLMPVPEGTVTAHGTILRLGRTIAAGTTEIRNGAGEVVAFGSATFYLASVRDAGGRPAAAAPAGIMKRTADRRRRRGA